MNTFVKICAITLYMGCGSSIGLRAMQPECSIQMLCPICVNPANCEIGKVNCCNKELCKICYYKIENRKCPFCRHPNIYLTAPDNPNRLIAEPLSPPHIDSIASSFQSEYFRRWVFSGNNNNVMQFIFAPAIGDNVRNDNTLSDALESPLALPAAPEIVVPVADNLQQNPPLLFDLEQIRVALENNQNEIPIPNISAQVAGEADLPQESRSITDFTYGISVNSLDILDAELRRIANLENNIAFSLSLPTPLSRTRRLINFLIDPNENIPHVTILCQRNNNVVHTIRMPLLNDNNARTSLFWRQFIRQRLTRSIPSVAQRYAIVGPSYWEIFALRATSQFSHDLSLEIARRIASMFLEKIKLDKELNLSCAIQNFFAQKTKQLHIQKDYFKNKTSIIEEQAAVLAQLQSGAKNSEENKKQYKIYLEKHADHAKTLMLTT